MGSVCLDKIWSSTWAQLRRVAQNSLSKRLKAKEIQTILTLLVSLVLAFIPHSLWLTMWKLFLEWRTGQQISGAQMAAGLSKLKKWKMTLSKEGLRSSCTWNKNMRTSWIKQKCKKLPKNTQISLISQSPWTDNRWTWWKPCGLGIKKMSLTKSINLFTNISPILRISIIPNCILHLMSLSRSNLSCTFLKSIHKNSASTRKKEKSAYIRRKF